MNMGEEYVCTRLLGLDDSVLCLLVHGSFVICFLAWSKEFVV
jgi:hypothetical protein